MKLLLSIVLFCSVCLAKENDIKSILVEKKEPATAVCYVSYDPIILSIAVDVPYELVKFIFNDTPVNEKQDNVWIFYGEKEVKAVMFGSKKVKADILKKEFKQKLLKLKGEMEAKIT